MSEPVDAFPAELLAERRARARARFEDGVLVLEAPAVRFVSRDTEAPYRPDSELHYLTGSTEPETVAVIAPAGTDPGFVLFVRPRDPEAERWSGPRAGPEEAGRRLGADAAYPLTELGRRLPGLLAGADRIAYRLGQGRPAEAHVLEALRAARIRGQRGGTGPRGVVDPGEVLDELRLRKDEHELARMRRAAGLTTAAFREMLGRVRPDVGEWTLQAAFEAAILRDGGDGPAYETIVASGPNACVLHYVANARRARAGELVLVDGGAAYGLYAADLTRTVPVGGFSAEQLEVYRIVDAARAAAVGAVAPGRTVDDVHAAATRVLEEGLVELGVLRGGGEEADGEALAAFYPHKTSHWLGLDVHDVGDYAVDGRSRELEPGMVLTIEPGLYFAEGASDGAAERFAGIGVRLEDDVLVTPDGHENLTAELPTDPDAIAALAGA